MSWLREPDAEPLPGYRLVEPLGSGGFGEVWSCRAPGGIMKAIKFVYGNLNAEDADAARAEQEKNALKKVVEVRHPFVVSMDRIEEVDGELLIVMEKCDKSLHDIFVECQQHGLPGIPRADLIRFLMDAAEGLDFMIESHKLLHLDVKPRNLFYVANHVKVADFGLVKNIERPSSAGVMAGVTPIYAAPETFSGRINRHCDQYSLGIVYVELLTGKRPFNGKNVRQIALQHMTEPPNLDGLPDGDRAAVARALDKDPEKRFPNCLSFVRALTPPAASATVIDESDEVDFSRNTPPPVHPDAVFDACDPPPTADLRDAARAARAAVRPGGAVADRPPPVVPKVTADARLRAAPPKRDGVLRPTLYVGIGSFGRTALLELRTRLLDRFGDLALVPCMRFLYLDSDPDAAQKATAGTSEVVLSPGEVFQMPLQPVGNYRKRMLEHLKEWLPIEKLYSIPRSLQPVNTRALGRLAFVDSFLRLQARVRRDLMQAAHPDALLQSAEQTGLPAGDASPVVVVLAGAVDGMSGMLADFGFGLRRLLDQLAYPHAATEALVYCGSPYDPATPSVEQANLYATLTELNHFASPDASFVAQYSPDGDEIADPRPPFDRVTLALRRDRTRPAYRECLAHAATFLANAAATSLGARLERQAEDEVAEQVTPFRGFGTSTTWYPRGLLLRVAARRACDKMIECWGAAGPANAVAEAHDRAARAFADDGLRPERIAAALEQLAVTPGDGTPTEATERFLQGLEVMGAGAEELAAWSSQAHERICEWAGPGTGFDPESTWKKSRFYRPLMAAAAKLAEEWDATLTGRVLKVLRTPGARLANGEAGLRRLVALTDEAAAAQLAAIEHHYQGTLAVRDALVAAKQTCSGGGFKLFGGPQRSLRHFHTQLREFARLRIRQDVLEVVLVFLKSLRGRMEDRIQELNYARQRLKALRQLLVASDADETFGLTGSNADASPLPATDAFWSAAQSSETVDIVLPYGETDLETSAGQFVDGLTTDHWLELDNHLQERVLKPLGNLHGACTGNANLLKYLGRPLLDEAAGYLGSILPITDVAQVEFSSRDTESLQEDFIKLHAAAGPAAGSSAVEANLSLLLTPDSDDGRSIGEVASDALPSLEVIATNSTTELTFCRVSKPLSAAELEQLLNLSRLAYQETAPQPASSPHARFDVLEWVPLEP